MDPLGAALFLPTFLVFVLLEVVFMVFEVIREAVVIIVQVICLWLAPEDGCWMLLTAPFTVIRLAVMIFVSSSHTIIGNGNRVLSVLFSMDFGVGFEYYSHMATTGRGWRKPNSISYRNKWRRPTRSVAAIMHAPRKAFLSAVPWPYGGIYKTFFTSGTAAQNDERDEAAEEEKRKKQREERKKKEEERKKKIEEQQKRAEGVDEEIVVNQQDEEIVVEMV
jgi:hypothetical protein